MYLNTEIKNSTLKKLVLDLQKNYEDSTEFSCILPTPSSPINISPFHGIFLTINESILTCY